MPKPIHKNKAPARPTKKARTEAPPKALAQSTKSKGSARPQSKAVVDTVPAKFSISEKRKGKAKEVAPASTKHTEAQATEEEDETTTLPSTFKVVAGSYEKLLYGLEGTVTTTDDSKLEFHLKPIFIFPAHVSCIKAVAASPNGGKWLASGSADEIVKVWDLRRRKEIGGLMHHEGVYHHSTPHSLQS